MPIVTAIKRQAKREDRFSVYLDGKYGFSLSESELIQLRLHEGDSITEKELNDFRFVSQSGKLHDRVLRLIVSRPRSEREIEQYLQKKDAASEVASEVMRRLKDEGRIDDEAFAKWWVGQRREFKLRSARALRAELTQKGVTREIVDDTLRDSSTENEVELLKQLIIRKQKQSRYQNQEKLMAYLARQGFDYHDIKQALNDIEQA